MEVPSPEDERLNRQGCMIGLFWLEQDKVCLGSPPVEEDPGVFLFPSQLSIGEGASRQAWPWADVTDLQVLDIPVRSTAARWTARLTSVVAAALNAWAPGGPSMMTAVVCAGENHRVETPVFSGAATAYTQREVDLSLGLLSHFVRGSASPSLLTQWWQENQPSDVLHSHEREAVLEGWLAPLM
ncbi:MULTISPECIES: hypothetical protein [Streptomyces]|uniref:Uncharacterized protein n=2 Tax=Streptomyces TaxID=1883 RepID=A0A7K3RLQ8_STRAQ|nr:MULTISPECIES: hypothetical protein [Streptomyces]NEC03114.1 hypothetical protein [Streptomyces anulatus]NED28795.1 hypothetical protein [Streptomyces anulatus]OWA24466.1 hypothetical protein B9W61_12225 [Streptomyces sp. CS057]